MKRLILIGNGFDLAHGLKTTYSDFLEWYLIQVIESLFSSGKHEDRLLKIHCKNPVMGRSFITAVEINSFFQEIQSRGFYTLFHNQAPFLTRGYDRIDFPFEVEGAMLLKYCINELDTINWVDVENEFYKLLVRDFSSVYRHDLKINIEELNYDLDFMIVKLREYLMSLPSAKEISDIYKIFFSSIDRKDFHQHMSDDFTYDLTQTLLLNFNYTSTPNIYRLPHLQINIHGALDNSKNPIIFGFGDERDEQYKKIEIQNNNEYFKHIKSFAYFKTSNYYELIRFIDSDAFQVFIMGHSCGLSDRTMLTTIFEHANCKSIKIYYHGTLESNNHNNLTMEISRHFNNKSEMRKKIVSEDKCQSMSSL